MLPAPVKNGSFKPPAGADGAYVRLTDGRHLLVRPLKEGAGVQLAIIGKRGGLVEAAPVPIDAVLRLILLVDGVSEIAWRAKEKFDRRKTKEMERRHAEALAGNRWLTEPRFMDGEVEYIVRPR